MRLTTLIAAIVLFSIPLQGKEEDPSGPDELKYTYGAKFEPPEGKILHGMGNFYKDNKKYVEMLGDEKIYPLSRLFYMGLETRTRTWDHSLLSLRKYIREMEQDDMIPHISIGFASNEGVGVDRAVAQSDKYDSRINDIVHIVGRYRKPVFLRIGTEFNGWWFGYTPYYFPKAFRKVVKAFHEKGLENIAVIWCYMPLADDDFDHRNSRGEYKWFPGEDVVDWFGIDLFGPAEFSAAASLKPRANGKPSPKANTIRFLKMAEKYRKPVYIAESSAAKVGITADPKKGGDYWKEWFEPYFDFIGDYPGIKAFHYINADWSKTATYGPQGWLDARIHINPALSKRYREEMKKSRYLHRDGLLQLNRYDEFRGR